MHSDPTTSFSDFLGKPWSDDNQELGERITCLTVHLNAGTYKLLKFICKFDRKDGWGAGAALLYQELSWSTGNAIRIGRVKAEFIKTQKVGQKPLF
jgi:hypothetical protein